MNKAAHRYYKHLCHQFPLHQKDEKQFLQFFKQAIEEYDYCYPDLSYDDYVTYFGEPKEIISAYYEHTESEYVILQMKVRTILKRILIIIFITSLIILSYFLIHRYQDQQMNIDSELFYEEITITDEGN